MIDQAVVMITLGYIRLDVLHQIHRGTLFPTIGLELGYSILWVTLGEYFVLAATKYAISLVCRPNDKG